MVSRVGYEIVLCLVEKVYLEERTLELIPIWSSNFRVKFLSSSAKDTLKFASSYAPYVGSLDPTSDRLNAIPHAAVSYPREGDKVIALVPLMELTSTRTMSSSWGINYSLPVIVLSKVIENYPETGPYDHIISDLSGARLHFNHAWEDVSKLVVATEEGGKDYQPPTGHVTLVGNRVVRLAGRKLLPFGLVSHTIGRGGDLDPVTISATTLAGEVVSKKKWTELFTRDPTEEKLYDDLLDAKGGLKDKKLLQPPCPAPGTMMDFHESGYKRLVETSGQVREYKSSAVSVVGDNLNDDLKKLSFQPDPESGDDEATQLPTQSPGEVLKHFIGDSGAISTLKMKQDGAAATDGMVELELNGISINVKNGDLPTALPVEFGGTAVAKNVVVIKLGTMTVTIDGTNDKFEVVTAGGKTFTVDGATNKMTFTGDLEVTGGLKVNGATGIETTAGDIKVASGKKLITGTVSDN